LITPELIRAEPNSEGILDMNSPSSRALLALVPCAMATIVSPAARADEGGVSFWLPGLYGSLAAVPGKPGWSFATFNYFDSVGAGRSTVLERGGIIAAGVDSQIDFQYLALSYTFDQTVLGGVATLGLSGLVGRNTTKASATLTRPGGAVIAVDRTDSVAGFGDLYPNFAIRWNQGVNNYMLYLTGDIPVGLYARQLANLGIGHAAVDGGGGYTYFNPETGNELSGVLGFTYNFINPMTQYQNGIDAHFDWAASHFLTPQWQVGAVGYVYEQLTGDSGSGDRLGPFRSSVVGIGPQIGYLFPFNDMQGYMNLKGYDEVYAKNRASGWNVWLTLSISPAAAAKPAVVAKY